MNCAEQLAKGVTLWPGDCLEVLAVLPECSIDSCVTDPPYHLTSIVKRMSAENAAPVGFGSDGRYQRLSGGFMGQKWDGGDIAFRPETWAAVYRVLKPGAHLIAFSGTRTYHRMVCAIEDAGFEVRDQIGWAFGSGFPKSHNIAVAIDKTNGIGPRGKAFNMKGRGDRAEELDANGREFLPPYEAATDSAKEWEGWGTALKPAWEPIVVARKPLSESTIAANVLKWGTGAINIDGCRVGTETLRFPGHPSPDGSFAGDAPPDHSGSHKWNGDAPRYQTGRWPANLIHDGSEEVVGAFPETTTNPGQGPYSQQSTVNCFGVFNNEGRTRGNAGDSGSAARFFYTAKADSDDRLGSRHPTVKPVDLIQYLVRLVTPKGGTCLDPFAGTGTLGEACIREGMKAVLIEREEEYQEDIRRRMKLAMAGPNERAGETAKARVADPDLGPLFAWQPEEYNAGKDLGGSIAEGFRVIRERVADGGQGWEPK